MNLIPTRKWFVVIGGLMFTCTPQKEKKWVWLGEPLDMTFTGAGPFDSERACDMFLDDLNERIRQYLN